MSDIIEIEKLVELFNIQKKDSDSEDEENQNNPETIRGIGNENPKPKSNKAKDKEKKNNPYAKIEKEERKSTIIEDPDDENEFGITTESEDHRSDWKKAPLWNISYRQQVSASDVFLQMGFKNPSTSSCEDMIVCVELPGENQKNIDLKILRQSLTLCSPKHYLEIPLPHPVDPQKGNAQFEKETQKLVITLRMERDLDCVNF